MLTRPWLARALLALAVAAAGAAPAWADSRAEDSGAEGGTFRASTAGAPLALAAGGWKNEDAGGRLSVDFAAAPQPADTSFSAEWLATSAQRSPSEGPQRLGVITVGDDTHNTVTETRMRLRLEYRVRVGSTWGPWIRPVDSDETFSRSNAGSYRHYIGTVVEAVVDCPCETQVQYRVSGVKSGLDASHLTVVVQP